MFDMSAVAEQTLAFSKKNLGHLPFNYMTYADDKLSLILSKLVLLLLSFQFILGLMMITIPYLHCLKNHEKQYI